MSEKQRIEIAIYLAFFALIMCAPLLLDPFWLNRIAKYLVFGMLGVAVALSWGYAGILNLGQGLFFGAGAYMLAMSLKLASPTSLQQGSDKPVPDFMLWNAEPGAPTELCCINKASFLWLPFQNQWFGVFMGLVLPVGIATIIGIIVFRKRISGVFVSIITLALVLLVRLVVIDAQPVTNGFNGLTDLGWFKVAGFEFDPYIVPTYYFVAIALCLVLASARLLIETRAGLILQAIRDDQNRARYLGFDVTVYQTFFFAVSAGIAHLHGSYLLDHHGGLGRSRRAFVNSRRLYRRHRHQHDLGHRQRDRGIRRGVEGHHWIDLCPRRPVSAAWSRGTGARSGRSFSCPSQGAAATRGRGFRRFPAGGVDGMAQAALTIDGLGVDFGGFKAVNNVSLIIEEGELDRK